MDTKELLCAVRRRLSPFTAETTEEDANEEWEVDDGQRRGPEAEAARRAEKALGAVQAAVVAAGADASVALLFSAAFDSLQAQCDRCLTLMTAYEDNENGMKNPRGTEIDPTQMIDIASLGGAGDETSQEDTLRDEGWVTVGLARMIHVLLDEAAVHGVLHVILDSQRQLAADLLKSGFCVARAAGQMEASSLGRRISASGGDESSTSRMQLPFSLCMRELISSIRAIHSCFELRDAVIAGTAGLLIEFSTSVSKTTRREAVDLARTFLLERETKGHRQFQENLGRMVKAILTAGFRRHQRGANRRDAGDTEVGVASQFELLTKSHRRLKFLIGSLRHFLLELDRRHVQAIIHLLSNSHDRCWIPEISAASLSQVAHAIVGIGSGLWSTSDGSLPIQRVVLDTCDALLSLPLAKSNVKFSCAYARCVAACAGALLGPQMVSDSSGASTRGDDRTMRMELLVKFGRCVASLFWLTKDWDPTVSKATTRGIKDLFDSLNSERIFAYPFVARHFGSLFSVVNRSSWIHTLPLLSQFFDSLDSFIIDRMSNSPTPPEMSMVMSIVVSQSFAADSSFWDFSSSSCPPLPKNLLDAESSPDGRRQFTRINAELTEASAAVGAEVALTAWRRAAFDSLLPVVAKVISMYKFTIAEDLKDEAAGERQESLKQHWSALRNAVGACIRTFGPSVFLSKPETAPNFIDVPLDDPAFTEKANTWILPLLAKFTERSSLRPLLTFFDMAEGLEAKRLQSEAKNRPVEARHYARIIDQIVALTPAFFREPTDFSAIVIEAGGLPKSMTKWLQNEDEDPKHVIPICRAITEFGTAVLQAGGHEPTLNGEDEAAVGASASRRSSVASSIFSAKSGQTSGSDCRRLYSAARRKRSASTFSRASTAGGVVEASHRCVLDRTWRVDDAALVTLAPPILNALIRKFIQNADHSSLSPCLLKSIGRIGSFCARDDSSEGATTAAAFLRDHHIRFKGAILVALRGDTAGVMGPPVSVVLAALIEHYPASMLIDALRFLSEFFEDLSATNRSKASLALSTARGVGKSLNRLVNRWEALVSSDRGNVQPLCEIGNWAELWNLVEKLKNAPSGSMRKTFMATLRDFMRLLTTLSARDSGDATSDIYAFLSTPYLDSTRCERMIADICLNAKDASARTRKAAFDAFSDLSHLCDGKLLDLVLRGLLLVITTASVTPDAAMLKANAAIVATQLLFENGPALGPQRINALGLVVLRLLKFNEKPSFGAALRFAKVLCHTADPGGLDVFFLAVVKSLDEPPAAHFRKLIKFTVEKFARKMGLEAATAKFPPEHLPLLANIKKRMKHKAKTRAKHLEARSWQATALDEDGSEDSRAPRKLRSVGGRLAPSSKKKEFAQFMQALEEEDSSDDDNSKLPPQQRKQRGSVASTPFSAPASFLAHLDSDEDDAPRSRKRKGTQAAPALREDAEGDVLDLMDPETATALVSGRKRRRHIAHSLPLDVDDAGRFIVKDDEQQPDALGGAYFAKHQSEKPKRLKGRTIRRLADEAVAESGTKSLTALKVRREAIKVAKFSHRKGHIVAKSPKEYKAPRASGDMKKDARVEPYAYVRLNRAAISAKHRSRALESLKEVITTSKRQPKATDGSSGKMRVKVK